MTTSVFRAQRVLVYLGALQDRIVTALETVDGMPFVRDSWQRPETSGGGGGTSCLLENGNVFERAGVGFSHVRGLALPPSAAANRPHLNGLSWQAMGVSLVIHPRNPHVPAVHMNVRFFMAGPDAQEQEDDGQHGNWWFGGGMDLTPFYGVKEDVVHFHRTCRDALAPFEAEARQLPAYQNGLHATFKKWCDDYFWLKHRNEARGVGGIFFDDLDALGFERCFALQQQVGNAFLDAYLPLVLARKETACTQAQRDFQNYRRGRYVEFNLVFDRGTLFGLQSGGRTESILMSMPPLASWRYHWQPEPGSDEAALYTDFLPHREWI